MKKAVNREGSRDIQRGPESTLRREAARPRRYRLRSRAGGKSAAGGGDWKPEDADETAREAWSAPNTPHGAVPPNNRRGRSGWGEAECKYIE